jgi:hypothetical protein
MRRRTSAIGAALVCLTIVTMGIQVLPAWATWTSENCFGASRSQATWKRSQALAYAQPAVGEGYEWGGGCYKLNDRDDTPTYPVDAGGEGADCSGFVFKTWGLKQDGTSGYRMWDHEKDVHGPYDTWDYISPSSTDPFKVISKTYSATQFMDAFVYRYPLEGHIGMIHTEGSGGFDYIVHARSNTLGTRIDWIDYRQSPDTKGLTRKNWTPECYPQCPGTGTRVGA